MYKMFKTYLYVFLIFLFYKLKKKNKRFKKSVEPHFKITHMNVLISFQFSDDETKRSNISQSSAFTSSSVKRNIKLRISFAIGESYGVKPVIL